MSFVTYNKKEKIWSGVKRELIFNPNVSLGSHILNEFKKTPERITQVFADTGVEVTCYEMGQRSMKMAKHLQSLGLKQGDVVGIMATNSEYLAPIVFACFTLGLAVNPLAPGMPENDIIHMCSKTKPKMIFCDAAFTQSLQITLNRIAHLKPAIYTIVDKIEGYEFVQDVLSADDKFNDFVIPELVDVANSTAVIMCTSGTTGIPKGVCKTQSELLHQLHRAWDCGTGKEEVCLYFSVIFWIVGIGLLVIESLHGGKRIITSKDFDPYLAIEICERYQVTTFLTNPYAISKIVQIPNLKPLESMRAFIATGTLFSESLSKKLEPLVPNGKVMVLYGTTEAGFIAGAFQKQRFGSCGYPTTNVQIKVLDDSGNLLGPNQIGEIYCKPKFLFSGYFEDLEKTAETLVDGWIKTDDTAYFDDDGFLFFIDRKKAILRYDAFCFLYPSKIEAIIDTVKGVRYSCVVGVPDESGNDIIFAIVEKDLQAEDLSAVKIENFVNGQVSDPEKLRGGVHFIDRIPLTMSGKIKRHEAKKFAEEIYRSKTPVFDIRTERRY